MYCKKCGRIIKEGAICCGHCGEPVSSERSQGDERQAVVPATVEISKNNNLKRVIIILAIVIVALIGIIAYICMMVLSDSDSDDYISGRSVTEENTSSADSSVISEQENTANTSSAVSTTENIYETTENVIGSERANTEQERYDNEATTTEQVYDGSFHVKVDGVESWDVLNIRASASPSAEIVGTLEHDDPTIYTIVETRKNGSSTWGKLKSGIGWINLKYTKRV